MQFDIGHWTFDICHFRIVVRVISCKFVDSFCCGVKSDPRNHVSSWIVLITSLSLIHELTRDIRTSSEMTNVKCPMTNDKSDFYNAVSPRLPFPVSPRLPFSTSPRMCYLLRNSSECPRSSVD